ncbi:hypothetical protein [Streptomyces sp. NRRL S-813]|uniref:hypothetical protein n=1 Tax=Streptomyces sp. NRRL S-813 TaxID=1463919 RepID=UPI0004C14206|nr:hypothetical protein [Streptomyces sp. NRRL S-813]
MSQESETTASTQARGPATYDLVIRGAHVFDGRQALAGLYDVAMSGGQIASVSAGPLRGRQEVDAAEGWVMPGLIDTHWNSSVDPRLQAGEETDSCGAGQGKPIRPPGGSAATINYPQHGHKLLY